MNRRQKAQDKIQEIFGDVLRRVPLAASMGEISLPKELLNALQDNIDKSRAGVMNVLSREISKVISRVDVARVMEEILRNNRIKLQAEIIFEPKEKKRRSKR